MRSKYRDSGRRQSFAVMSPSLKSSSCCSTGSGARVANTSPGKSSTGSRLTWATAAAVARFVAPGPMEVVHAIMRRRYEALAKATAAWPIACSLWARSVGRTSRAAYSASPSAATLPCPNMAQTPANTRRCSPSTSVHCAAMARTRACATVAAPDRYGADTAAEILAAGGNAVDAAVAVGFTLAVTYPEAGNLGGGGFATVLVDGKAYFLDYRECAPGSASAGMYLDAAGEVIPDASTIGAGAAGVPGTVAGLWQLHRRFGRLPWRADLAPALRYAHEGFRVDRLLIARRDQFAARLHGRTNFLAYFGALAPDATFRQSELEATLRRIAAAGPRGFYAGRTAELIAAELARSHGHITRADLAAYRPVWREPLAGDWAGYRVLTAPLPSSGGIALLSMLAMNADFGSGQVVSGAGFLLNNEMDDFSAKPGAPNIYGVVGADANTIAPGKRPLSTMTPTILTEHGRVAVVIGTLGGSRIATWIFQVLTNWHDFHLPLEAAVAAPRIHHQLLPPDTLFEEPYATLNPAARAALSARGYTFVNQGWNGDIHVIVVGDPGATAVADPRGRGVARVLAPGKARSEPSVHR